MTYRMLPQDIIVDGPIPLVGHRIHFCAVRYVVISVWYNVTKDYRSGDGHAMIDEVWVEVRPHLHLRAP